MWCHQTQVIDEHSPTACDHRHMPGLLARAVLSCSMTKIFTFALLAVVGLCGSSCSSSTTGEGEGEPGEGEGEPQEGEGEEGEGEEGEGEGCPGDAFAWPTPQPITIPISDEVKTSLSFDPANIDAFFSTTGAARFAKGVVFITDPDTVYFQDVNQQPFHAGFAIASLPPFAGLTRQQFDERSLYANGQQAMLVTLLFVPGERRIGIQLVREDPYPLEQALLQLRLVRDSLSAASDVTFVYAPTRSQASCTNESSTAFAAAGFEVVPTSTFGGGDDGVTCYSNGFGVGRLVAVEGAIVQEQFAAGVFGADDIIVLDVVPAEVPAVRGIISLSAATPASHVALLATQAGIPFVSVDSSQATQVQTWLGQDIVMQAGRSDDVECGLDIFAADSLDAAAQQVLIDAHVPEVVTVDPPVRANSALVDPADVTRASRATVGGKGVGAGLLVDAVPAQTPPAQLIPIDLFVDFLATPIGDDIDATLASLGDPIDPVQASVALVALQERVRAAPLPASVDQVLSALAQVFPSDVKLRFRSSTNAEDGDTFTGAGLYDSASGCLADDLDGDEVGPSVCNPARADERGAKRAISKVFASLYNVNAVLERARRRVNEANVAMAVVVQPSFDDDNEVANGVIIATTEGGFRNVRIISQPGARSVTNPPDGETPEEVDVLIFGDDIYIDVTRRASTLGEGTTLVNSEDPATNEYRMLVAHIIAIMERWSAVTGDPSFVLDLEYKKVDGGAFIPPDGLVIKQVRPFVSPSSSATVPAVVLPPARPLCVFEGEQSDVFALHRLKGRITTDFVGHLAADGPWMGAWSTRTPAVGGPVDDEVPWSGTFISEDSYHHHQQSFEGGLRDWLVYAPPVALTGKPVARLAGNSTLQHEYTSGVLFHGYDPATGLDGFSTRLTDTARLTECNLDDGPAAGETAVTLVMSTPSGAVRIESTLYWPLAPGGGASAGYTAPLQRWGGTVITGLTTSPIVLSSPWSQTYRPAHHNFGAEMIFEPLLEPGLSATQLAELEAAGITALFAIDEDDNDEIFAISEANDGRELE
jgi:hypothetical protein